MYKGAAHFNRGAQLSDKSFVIFIERAAIQPFNSISSNDLVNQTNPIGSCDTALRFIPQKEMSIMRIKLIGILRKTSSLSHCTKRLLPGNGDLLHNRPKPIIRCEIHIKFVMLDNPKVIHLCDRPP